MHQNSVLMEMVQMDCGGGDRTPAWKHDDREHRGPPCSKELRAGGWSTV